SRRPCGPLRVRLGPYQRPMKAGTSFTWPRSRRATLKVGLRRIASSKSARAPVDVVFAKPAGITAIDEGLCEYWRRRLAGIDHCGAALDRLYGRQAWPGLNAAPLELTLIVLC